MQRYAVLLMCMLVGAHSLNLLFVDLYVTVGVFSPKIYSLNDGQRQ